MWLFRLLTAMSGADTYCSYCLLVAVISTLISTSSSEVVSLALPKLDPNGVRNCSYNDYVCQYKIVDCDEYPYAENRTVDAGSAFEIRIDARTPMILAGGSIYHILDVSAGWILLPYGLNLSTEGVSFLISAERLDVSNARKKCFFFDFTKSKLKAETKGSYPSRFQLSFHTNDFELGGTYNFTFVPFPESENQSSFARATVRMPYDPEIFQDTSECENFDEKNGNSQASKWISSFYKIMTNEIQRSMYVSFIGAPAGFCFEEYVIALVLPNKKEPPITTKIRTADLKPVEIGNKTYLFGDHTFVGLEYDVEYTPTVTAESELVREINDARKEKCVCRHVRLFDSHNGGSCMCISAKYHPVTLRKLQRPPASGGADRPNRTFISVPPRKGNTTMLHIALFGAAVVALFLLGLIYFMFVRLYRQYHNRKIIIHFGPSSNRPGDKVSSFPADIPLIPKDRTNVLIIYSHDSQPHDDAVMALAGYLQDSLGFNVHVDQWENEEMESNVMDYVAASVQKADRIIIVNSVGAYNRYQAKIEHEWRVERINRGPYDPLFTLQIDSALGRQPCVLSVRFAYTSAAYVLPPLSVALQYVLPDNVSSLQTALCKYTAIDLPADANSELLLKMGIAVSRMTNFIAADPNWFDKTHCVVTQPILQGATLIPLAINEDSDNGTLTSEHEDSVVTSPSMGKVSDAGSETRKSSSATGSESSDDNAEVDSAVVDSKLDSGIHTEEEYYNSETMPSLKNTNPYYIDPKSDGAVRKIEDALIIEKNDSGYIGEVRSINVYS